MNATELVPTLETCRALWDAGVGLETYFGWFGDPEHFPEPGKPWVWVSARLHVNNQDADHRENIGAVAPIYPAPTFEELWAIIPGEIQADGKEAYLKPEKYFTGSEACYYDPENQEYLIESKADTVTEALALLLLELIQAGHVRPENLNVK